MKQIQPLFRRIPGYQLTRRATGRGLAYGRYLADFVIFSRLSRQSSRMKVPWTERHPCLDERTPTTRFDRHYVFHTAWAARAVAAIGPKKHIDISSSLFFVTGLSAFLPVEFYDFRPPDLELSNLSCNRADLTNLPFPERSVDSISCMHVVEHIGLGRYGESLDPDGDVKAMRELQRVVAPGGSLLLVTPLGRPRVCYNAHRVYGFDQVVENFPDLKLHQFALVPDQASDGGLLIEPDRGFVATQSYACGCFWFKRAAQQIGFLHQSIGPRSRDPNSASR